MRAGFPLALFAAASLFAALSWGSGSLWGTWAIECSVGTLAHDLAHGLNPALSPFDYFDRYAVGYLFAGLAAAPLVALGVPAAWATKAVALATFGSVLALAWTLLRRHASDEAARWGVALLALPPPLIWAFAIQGGNFHYLELVPELGLLLVAAEIGLRGRRGAWFGLLGLLAGLPISTSFGAAAFVAATAVWLLAFDERPWRWDRWLAPVGLLAGTGPLLWKLAVHSQHGQGKSEGLGIVYVRLGDVGRLVEKAAAGLRDLPSTLVYADAWGHPAAAWFGVLFVGLVVAAALGTLLLHARLLLVGLRSLLPGRALAPHRGYVALLLVGWLLAFALAYLLSDQRIAAQVGVDAQLRANRFLPAPLALAAVLPALLLPAAGSLHSALGWPLRGAMAGVLLGGLGSWVGAVHWPDAGVGVAYRGRCYELVGLYMAQTHPDPLGPRRDWQVCDGFAPPGPQECFEGWLWGIGQSQVYPGAAGWQLSELGVRGCSALPEPWQGDCWRQVGWGITMRVLPVSGRGTPAVVAAACDRLPPAGRWRCREGYGFYLADHYGFAPDKVAAQLQRDAPSPQDRRAYARGFGPLLRHELAELATADAWCSRLPAEDRADCREGAALAFGLEGRALPR